jgi:3-oxoadipate enol-lactonase
VGSCISGRAPTRDGFELAYWVKGHGPTRIVLIHSLAIDHNFWNPVVERIASFATVLIYDCRGHGQSDKPPGPYTVEQFADDLTDVLNAAGWPDAVVAGASMGGSVALAFAGRHSSRLTALGLFDTTAWYGADAPQQWRERAEKALSSGFPALVDFQQTRWFGDDFRERHRDVVDATVATFLANDVRAYAETCRMLGAADLRGVLTNISVPTRIAVGEEDYATPPAMSEALHAGIPGSTLTVLKGGRHLTPLEMPERIADELRTLIGAPS